MKDNNSTKANSNNHDIQVMDSLNERNYRRWFEKMTSHMHHKDDGPAFCDRNSVFTVERVGQKLNLRHSTVYYNLLQFEKVFKLINGFTIIWLGSAVKPRLSGGEQVKPKFK